MTCPKFSRIRFSPARSAHIFLIPANGTEPARGGASPHGLH